MHPFLSARQEQCVRLTAFRTDKEIAAHLGISEATVKKHVHEACQRLGVNRRKAALALLDPVVPDVAKKTSPVNTGPETTGGRVQQSGAVVREEPPRSGDGERSADDIRVDPVSAAGVQNGSGRWGYRSPPGNAALRLAVITVLTIVLALLVVTLVVMLGDMHKAVGELDGAIVAG